MAPPPLIISWLKRVWHRDPAPAVQPVAERPMQLSFAEQPRPEGPVVLVLGETPGVAALVHAAGQICPGLTVLCVGSDAATFVPLQEDDGTTVLWRPLPADAPSFAGHWRPDVALIFTSALAQPLSGALLSAGVPVVMICDRPPTRGQRRQLRQADHVFAIGTEAGSALERLGLPEAMVTVCATIEDVTAVPGWNEAERDAMAGLIAGRPLWLAAQTTPDEDRIIVEAQTAVARLAHRLLLILVPDDPARGPELARLLRERGWQVARRSAEEEPDEETQIYLADTRDELGLWYRLAPISFLGGSLDGTGSIDPFAAASLGSAILHGPHHGGHGSFLDRLDDAKAAREVHGATELAQALDHLISPDQAAGLAHDAWQIATEGAETALWIATRLCDLLDRTERG